MIHHVHSRDRNTVAAIMDSVRFVFRRLVIGSTMLLDSLATFSSSATALLAIFARDILQVGPRGCGWLYAAPAIAAVTASAAMLPITPKIDRRGMILIWAVTMYGVATVVFGFSRSFWLTMACLALVGAADAVSMIIRNIVRQI